MIYTYMSVEYQVGPYIQILQATQMMVAMGIFPFKGKFSQQNQESNPGPHGEWSEVLTTKP
jgi:hypothetical protein